MSTARRNILENIIETLSNLSHFNGYAVEIPRENIHRNLVSLSRKMVFPTIYLSVSDTVRGEYTGDNSSVPVDRELLVNIELIVGGENTDQIPDSLEDYIEAVVEEMAKDPTRGSLAVTQSEPEIQEPNFSQVFQENAWVRIAYIITYRVTRGDFS